MKNFIKITSFVVVSMFFVLDANAEEWSEKDCEDYEQLIGVLVWSSGETLEMVDEARKANKKEEAEELFEAS